MTPARLVSAFVLGFILPGRANSAPSFVRESLSVPDERKVTVTPEIYPGLTVPNPRGWYYKCANVARTADGTLVACWQMSDNHTSLMSHLMVARSTDGGRHWGEYQVIASADVWTDRAVWVVPQLSALRDGRLVIVCDRGQRGPGQNFPMLADWQKPERGMANFVFWSADNGRTWSKGEQVDAVGGEPGYILEQSDGTLAFTRTSSATTTKLKNPPLPWGNIYYRNEIVFSDDRGKTWDRTAWLADNPFYGDCEVGLAELAPRKLIAATRIGLGNGRFGHPSRLLYSDDGGRTWPRAEPAPFYGQRVHLEKLRSGKLLATFRNRWGTPGSRALVFDPNEKLGFQPTSWILEENRCELKEGEMILRTEDGKRGAVEFSLFPAQDDQARVVLEAELKVEQADLNGCALSAGVWVRITPDRVCLADRPELGFPIDARTWHSYRLERENGELRISVDGAERLRTWIDDLWVREVRFGNRAVAGKDDYVKNRSTTFWRSLAVQVSNPGQDSIDWHWTPAAGYPDQFRRDRIVVLDVANPADCGYSSWTELPDGKIVILDYTTGEKPEDFGRPGAGPSKQPFIRAYLVRQADLERDGS